MMLRHMLAAACTAALILFTFLPDARADATQVSTQNWTNAREGLHATKAPVRRSRVKDGGALAGGIVMVVIGGLLLASVSPILISQGEAEGGAGTIVAGLHLVGGGIPLIAGGAQREWVSTSALDPPHPNTASFFRGVKLNFRF